MNSALKKTALASCRILPGASAILLLMCTAAAYAADGTTEWRPIYDTIMRWVNFFILVFLIYRYGRQPFKNFLAGRKYEVTREIDELEDRRKEIENQIAETRRQIEESGKRFEKIKARIKEEGRRKRQQIIDQANEQSRKMIEMEKKKAASQIAQARMRLLAETTDKASEMALQRLARELTDEDHHNLINLYLDNVNRMSTG